MSSSYSYDDLKKYVEYIDNEIYKFIQGKQSNSLYEIF